MTRRLIHSDDGDVVTTGEASKLSGVSQQTIIRCADRGEIQSFLLPGSRHRRIYRRSLEAWMERNRIGYHHEVDEREPIERPSPPDRTDEAAAFRETDIAVNIDRQLWERLKRLARAVGRPAKAELEMAVEMLLCGEEEEHGLVPPEPEPTKRRPKQSNKSAVLQEIEGAVLLQEILERDQ